MLGMNNSWGGFLLGETDGRRALGTDPRVSAPPA